MKMLNSINETYNLCKEQNIGISRRHITQLVKDGQIPCLISGRKCLINWSVLMEYIQDPKKEINFDPKIRRIS